MGQCHCPAAVDDSDLLVSAHGRLVHQSDLLAPSIKAKDSHEAQTQSRAILEEVRTSKKQLDWELSTGTGEPDGSLTTASDAMQLKAEATTLLEHLHGMNVETSEQTADSILKLAECTSLSQHTRDALQRANELVEDEFDILAAYKLLLELRTDSSPSLRESEEWAAVTTTPVFKRCLEGLSVFRNIGLAVCDQSTDWFTVWEDSAKHSLLAGRIDANDPTLAHFRMRVFFPVSLVNAVSITAETDLTRLWNGALEKDPDVLGRRQGLQVYVSQQMTVLCGLLKFDALDEIQRYVDVDGGFMAELVDSIPEGHPHYRAAPRGYNRAISGLKSAWVACGSEASVLILTGSIQMPFSISKRFARTLGSYIGRNIVSSMVKNSLRTQKAGNPWADALAKDRFGLYSRLSQCMASEASMTRGRALASLSGKQSDSCIDLDLDQWFTSI